MFAVVKSGGKQYSVKVGDELSVELLSVDRGAQVLLEDVLLISDQDQTVVGAPCLPGAVVSATVLDHGRGQKIRIFKMSRRKHYRKTQGHRQYFTRLRIDAISLS